MASKLTPEYIGKRIESLSQESINYYMTTPLSELKTREEKMIKKELKNRSLSVLHETDTTVVDTPVEKPVEAISENVEVKPLSEDNTSGETSLLSDMYNSFTGWFSSLPTQLGEYWDSSASAIRDVYESISGWIHNFSLPSDPTERHKAADAEVEAAKEQFYKDNLKTPKGDGLTQDDSNSDASELEDAWKAKEAEIKKGYEVSTFKYAWAGPIFMGVIIVLAIWAIWKVIKYFITDDGDVKTKEDTETSEATSENFNPMSGNICLAALQEGNDEYTNMVNHGTPLNEAAMGMTPVLNRYANNAIDGLLNDPKFVAYMEKASPKLLECLKKYKEEQVPVSESITNVIHACILHENNLMTLSEDTEPMNAEESGGMLNSIFNTFSRAGSYISDSAGYIVDKVKDLHNRITNSKYAIVRWIPEIVSMAIGVMVIAYLFHQYETPAPTGTEPAPKMPTTPGPDGTTGLGTNAGNIQGSNNYMEKDINGMSSMDRFNDRRRIVDGEAPEIPQVDSVTQNQIDVDDGEPIFTPGVSTASTSDGKTFGQETPEPKIIQLGGQHLTQQDLMNKNGYRADNSEWLANLYRRV